MSKQDKRIRKEAKSLYQTVVEEIVNPRLDTIEKFCQEQLTKMAEQQKRINGFVVGEVKFTIANELDDAKVTREALLEILNEKLGVEGFAQLVADRKPITRKRLIAEAEAAMAAAQEEARVNAEAAKNAADAQAAAAAAPAEPHTEAPVAPVQE